MLLKRENVLLKKFDKENGGHHFSKKASFFVRALNRWILL